MLLICNMGRMNRLVGLVREFNELILQQTLPTSVLWSFGAR